MRKFLFGGVSRTTRPPPAILILVLKANFNCYYIIRTNGYATGSLDVLEGEEVDPAAYFQF